MINEETIEKRNRILELKKQGYTGKEIATIVGCSPELVYHYIRKNDWDVLLEKEEKEKKHELLIVDLIKTSNSLYEVCKKLNKKPTNTNYKRLRNISKKYNVDVSKMEKNKHQKRKPYTIDEVLCVDSKVNSYKVRNLLLKNGIKEHRCESCKRTEWEGEIIPLQLHHINAINTDNRIENLMLLCPNCHALTDSYCGKNKTKKKKDVLKATKEDKTPTREEIIEAFKANGSFVKTALFFGVSDNGLRKWCIKRNLPKTKKEMKSLLK